MDEIRARLLADLKKRVAFDNRYSWQHLYLASFWNWVAIVGSFAAAVLAATATAPSWLVAILAAVPGVAVVILQRFSFYRRSRFHLIMQVNVEKLIRALEYENANPGDVSKEYSELRLRMEPSYPGQGLDSLTDEKTTGSAP